MPEELLTPQESSSAPQEQVQETTAAQGQTPGQQGSLLVGAEQSQSQTETAVPTSVEGYDFDKDIDATTDTLTAELRTQFKEKALELGLTNEAAKKLFSWYSESMGKSAESTKEAIANQQKETVELLKKEWGPKYDGNINRAVSFVNQHFSEETKKLLNETGLGDNPVFIKQIAEVAKKFTSEDTVIVTQSSFESPEVIQEQIKAFRAQNQEILFNPSHPEHNQKQRELSKMYEKAYKN